MRQPYPAAEREWNNAQISLQTLGQKYADAEAAMFRTQTMRGNAQQINYTTFRNTLISLCGWLKTMRRTKEDHKDIDKLRELCRTAPEAYDKKALELMEKNVLWDIEDLFSKYNIMDYEIERLPMEKSMSAGQR